MKKRMLYFLPALLLALLCGCVRNAPATEPSGTGTCPTFTPGEAVDFTDLAGGSLSEEELAACIEQAKQAAEQVPEYTGSPLIPADPDRKIYIAIGEQDVDYYPDAPFGGCSVFILTREAYSVDQIRVNIPMQTEYEVIVQDLTEHCGEKWSEDAVDNLCMNAYHYLCRQGVDWRWLAQERKNVESAFALFGGDPHTKEYQAYLYMDEAYDQLLEDYQAQYEAMPQEEIPQFHVYHVDIIFTDIGSYDETAETVEFIIGDVTYPMDIGQWRFHRQNPEELKERSEQEGLTQYMLCVTGVVGTPYDGEIAELLDALSFTANEDLTVTGVRQLTEPIDILGGRVIISDAGGGSADFFWDLQRPLEITTGSQVSIHLYVKDALLTQYLAKKSAYLVMDYEVNRKSQSMVLPCMLWRSGNVWEYYLMAFEGYDMGEYYTCYMPDMTAYWMKDLPEEWLQ